MVCVGVALAARTGVAPAADATAALVQLGNTVTKKSDQDPEHCSAWLIQSGVLF